MAAVLLTGALAGAFAGCAGPLNTEHSLGNARGRGVWTPPTIGESAAMMPTDGFAPALKQSEAPVYGAQGPVPAPDASRSLVSLDRANWAPSTIDVPVDLPTHPPRLATNWLDTRDSARAQGQFPTAASALATTSNRRNEAQMREAVAAPFIAASDVILMPFRAAASMRPMQPTRTGSWPYARQPSPGMYLPLPFEVVGDKPAVAIDPKQAKKLDPSGAPDVTDGDGSRPATIPPAPAAAPQPAPTQPAPANEPSTATPRSSRPPAAGRPGVP